MYSRDSDSTFAASRRGLPAPRASLTRFLRWKALALLAVVGLTVATVESCVANHNRDGSVTFTFAPDMVITAWGLEEALSDLQDLLRSCLAGTWTRPCTDGEIASIERMHAKVLDQKELLNHD